MRRIVRPTKEQSPALEAGNSLPSEPDALSDEKLLDAIRTAIYRDIKNILREQADKPLRPERVRTLVYYHHFLTKQPKVGRPLKYSIEEVVKNISDEELEEIANGPKEADTKPGGSGQNTGGTSG